MTHLTTLLTSFALLSAACAQDKKGDRHRDEKRKGPPRPEEFIKVYDENGDDKVSKEEFGAGARAARLDPAIREKIFSRLDKNADGFITKDELGSMTPNKGFNPLAKADIDKDGRISKDEFAGHGPFAKMSEERREKMFTRLDHDSDGFLDPKDGRFGGRKGGRGEKHFPKIKMKGRDLDENGSLSWEEFKKAPHVLAFSDEERRKAFDRIDADRNGQITSEELRSHAEARPGPPHKKPRPRK